MHMKSLGTKVLRRGRLWLSVIRDAFVVLMPLTFLGLLALVLQHFPWGPYREAMAFLWGTGWASQLDKLINASLGVFGMVLASVVSALLTRRLMRLSLGGVDALVMVAAISGLINFMLMVSVSPFYMDGIGRTGMLQGIVVGLITAEALRWVLQWQWLQLGEIPYDSDPIYSQVMRNTPAVIVVGFAFFGTSSLFNALPSVPINVLSPLVSWAQLQQTDATWLTSSLAVIVNQVGWLVGVHGAQLLDTYGGALFAPIGAPYTDALAWRPLFNHFALMGGAGATLSLVIAILINRESGQQNQVAKWSLLPAFFNINEAVLYGLPIVLNGAYLLPFLAVPLLFTLMTLAVVELGGMSFVTNDIPWTTPPIVSGWLLTGSWRGAALQILEIGLGVLIYLPFVRSAETARKARDARMVKHALKSVAEEIQKSGKFLIRQNATGVIARGLLAELRNEYQSHDAGLWLAYEPKHDTLGRVVGVEALIRWTHPVHGAIAPAVIVALAESGSSIRELGMWVLEHACICKARWNALGYKNVTMAINVSPLQLEDVGLASKLEQLLRQHGLEASEFELEITESVVIPDSQAVEQTLRKFVSMGVRLAMDDFGMGHSSLLYLRRFHVQSIKIDGSLTRDVLSNSTNADIIRTIVQLGRFRNVGVVAEYVETREQRLRLAELGCDIFQGYFFSPPLSEDQCPAYFAKHQVDKPVPLPV